MSNEKTTNVAVVSGSADPKPAVKDASAESKIDFKVKKVRIERLDVKGTLSYRGFTKISGKVVSVKVARGWETFSPNCEVPVSEIIELREATPAQLKRYNKDQKK